MKALAALALLLPLPALAELQVFVVDKGVERPLGALFDVGSTAAGDVIQTRFRVRGPGSLHTIKVSGAGFALGDYPPLPYTLAADAPVDFTVRFAPNAAGAYSASLSVNSAVALLRGVAFAAVEVRVDGQAALQTGDAVDFGRVELGATSTRRLHLLNRTGGWLRVALVAVEGQVFSGPAGLSAPLMLDAGQDVAFDLAFAPRAAGAAEGALEVDGRRFVLRGTGLPIPLPRPTIRIDPGAAAGAQQGRLRVEFAAPSRAAGSGELRVEFRSAVAGVAADPSILLLPMSSRFAPFTVREGDTVARFGDRDDITFQTGTTAGALVFTARLGENSEQAIMTIAPSPVEFESLQSLRSGSQIELQLAGYDNVRTVSRMTFTFYDAKDVPVAPGPIAVGVAAEFRRYFETAAVGGAFALRAVFPISGKPSDVVSVDIEAVNSIGATRPARVRIN